MGQIFLGGGLVDSSGEDCSGGGTGEGGSSSLSIGSRDVGSDFWRGFQKVGMALGKTFFSGNGLYLYSAIIIPNRIRMVVAERWITLTGC